MSNAAVKSPQLQLKELLGRAKDSIQAVCTKDLKADRLIKVVLSATARDPKLLRCTLDSILNCAMQSAELGLEIGGLMGEAYFIPFKRNFKDDHGNWQHVLEAKLVTGYKGLIKLSHESGTVNQIYARVVYPHETFDLVCGTDERLIHRPAPPPEGFNPAHIMAVYAVAELRNGAKKFEVMWKSQVDAIRDRKKNQNSRYKTDEEEKDTPWDTDYPQMAKKTGIRRLCNGLPLSSDDPLRKALEVDAAGEAEEYSTIDTVAEPQSPAQLAEEPMQAAQRRAVKTAALTAKLRQGTEVLDEQGEPQVVGA